MSPPVGSIHASVWDITSGDGLPDGISPSSVDIVVLVFVLSALHPAEWARAVSNIYKVSPYLPNIQARHMSYNFDWMLL